MIDISCGEGIRMQKIYHWRLDTSTKCCNKGRGTTLVACITFVIHQDHLQNLRMLDCMWAWKMHALRHLIPNFHFFTIPTTLMRSLCIVVFSSSNSLDWNPSFRDKHLIQFLYYTLVGSVMSGFAKRESHAALIKLSREHFAYSFLSAWFKDFDSLRTTAPLWTRVPL